MFFFPFVFFFLFEIACIDRESEDNCAEFVEYICKCHSKNPKYNCTELKNIYRDADFEKQEQCTLQLDDQIYEDTKNKLPCTLEIQTDAPKKDK